MDGGLNNLSISELKKIKKDNQQKLKKEYEELKKKQKLIEEIIKIQKTREKINKNQNPNQNQKSRHLMIISKSVLKIKKFLQIPLPICEKHLKEQLGNIIKEQKKKNRLLTILLINTL